MNMDNKFLIITLLIISILYINMTNAISNDDARKNVILKVNENEIVIHFLSEFIPLNHNKMKIYNIGLSDIKINGTISFYIPWNIGVTQIKQNLNGNLKLDKYIRIDEDTINFIKNDVEGHELKVLQGAKDHKMKVNEYLINFEYRLEKEFSSSNYLYIFDHKE
ncbi:hypothetical protein H8356DRAFT_1427114 [Neocallimastix lanati (nom. inval.)]|nr:hypothetical protein H8356DRAFT_1427114 [Neocallimastix sp. JGI-2020a]